jgi:hypothetical protein
MPAARGTLGFVLNAMVVVVVPVPPVGVCSVHAAFSFLFLVSLLTKPKQKHAVYSI